MTGFSAHWLALREPADIRARNSDLADRAGRLLAGRDSVGIVDLGAGTGSNLRASAHLFGPVQHWRLLDYDPALLAQARIALAAWADESAADGESLKLVHEGRRISVDFAEADLSCSLAEIGRSAPDLVTASAFFDLVSQGFIDGFAEEVARLGAVFFTVLSCDGRDHWVPEHAADAAIAAAFRADQAKDKGFGPALGNACSDRLEAAFHALGYQSARADSPWQVGPDRAGLLEALALGTANAAVESGQISPEVAASWASGKTVCTIGHTDFLAWPLGTELS